MNYEETSKKINEGLTEKDINLLEETLSKFNLPEKPLFDNSWVYDYSHLVYVLKNYVVAITKLGHKQKSGMTLEESINHFLTITNNISESLKNYEFASVPKYFKTKKENDYLIIDSLPERKTFFEDGYSKQKPAVFVREKPAGKDLQELIGGFIKSNENSFDEYIISEFKLSKEELIKKGLNKEYFIGYLLGQSFKLIHKKTGSADSYLKEHERRLKEVYEDEFVEKAIKNYEGKPCLTLFDPRLRNIGLSNSNGLPHLDFFDTDGSRIASAGVDVYFFDKEVLLNDLIRTFGEEHSEKLNKIATGLNKSFFEGYGKQLSDIPNYPLMSKLELSNLLYEPHESSSQKLKKMIKPFNNKEEALKYIKKSFLKKHSITY